MVTVYGGNWWLINKQNPSLIVIVSYTRHIESGWGIYTIYYTSFKPPPHKKKKKLNFILEFVSIH